MNIIVWAKYFLIAYAVIMPTSLKAQCPVDSSELIINTQEKYDHFFATYPDCRAFHIILVKGELAGEPKPFTYLVVFSVIMILIYLFLKYVINKWKLS